MEKKHFLLKKNTFLTQLLNINEFFFQWLLWNFLNLGIIPVYFYHIQSHICILQNTKSELHAKRS